MKENTAFTISGILPQWGTSFEKVDIRALTNSAVKPNWAPGEARPRFISISGFEQKHIVTSQIASG